MSQFVVIVHYEYNECVFDTKLVAVMGTSKDAFRAIDKHAYYDEMREYITRTWIEDGCERTLNKDENGKIEYIECHNFKCEQDKFATVSAVFHIFES